MLNSPLYRQTQAIAEHQQKINAGLLPKDAPLPKTNFEEVEGFEVIYQFSVPVAQARRELAKGRDFFRERAMVEIADKHPPTHIPDLIEAVVLSLQRGFSTVIQHTAPTEDGETIVNFPKPPEAIATASAGGSDTSAH